MSRFLYWLLTSLIWLWAVALLPCIWLFKYRHREWLKARLLPAKLLKQPNVWIHAVSVGELKIAFALLNAIPASHRRSLLITTTTPAGLAFMKKSCPFQAELRLLPWDVSWCYRRFFSGLKVPSLIIVETEIWPALFQFVKKHDASLSIVNGRMSQKTLRFKNLSVLRHAIGQLDVVAARTANDADRFVACGLGRDAVQVSGNIKFDFVVKELGPGALRDWLAQSQETLIFASMATEEASLLAELLWDLFQSRPQLNILWAPRQLQETESHLRALVKLEPVRRSAEFEPKTRCLVLDTMGELASCYAFGKVSFIGGSFNKRGGQNFLESLQVGTPAIVGPSTENFKNEVAQALEHAALVVVNKPKELSDSLIELLDDQQKRQQLASQGVIFLSQHTGAVARSVDVLLDSQLLEKLETEAL